jgi:hypothetical protein
VVNPIVEVKGALNQPVLGKCLFLGKNMVEAIKSGKPGNLEVHNLEVLGV